MNLSLLNSIWRRRPETHPVSAQSEHLAVSTTAVSSQNGEIEPSRFVARQAIFDRNRNVYGYELLFRSGWENSFRGDTDQATRIMIADGALYGFHELTRGAPTFVNCTRESLVNGLVTLLPTSTVLEIVETVGGNAEVLEACARYKSLGYKLALDDFQLNDGMEGLMDLADYIKVDFSLSDANARREILSALHGRNVTLLAEKVETEEEFNAAMAEGFTLFQGYFFCHPIVFSKKRLPSNGVNYLYLLSALVGGDFRVAQIAILLQSEVALSYQLLRLVNSAGFCLDKEVRSLQDALILVGEKKFRILLLNAIATETCRSRPRELLVHVLHRARFLELMAAFTGESEAEQYLLGLLSLMDVMLDVPITELMEALPLRKEMRDALHGEPNRIGVALRLFKSYEDADWEACMNESFTLSMTESELSGTYRDSLVWAENCIQSSEPKILMTN
jgi:c-di-GMP-related signal transduction protein